ncbi:MAG: M23 family metallopeptidase [Clostridia bacterium]|nr:M23 family metallopeptidase [Clostridia bacterium]
MNTPVKSILTALVCVAALFIPSYVAIANYVTAQNAPVDEKSVSKLEITDMAGNLFTLSSDDTAGAKAIADFVAVNGRAAEQTSLPEPLVGTDYFEFKYYSYDRVSTYKYYYSTNPSEAYFVDSNNTAYRITEDDAVSFLSTTYARCLYNTTSFPVMTISGETVAPVEGDWAYKTYGGEYVALDDIPLGQLTEKVYRMKGAFALSFDDEPDFLTVTISDGGTVIYSDLYANIANASLEGKTIDVVVEAKWYETEEQSCSGSAVYKFKAKILLPAVFYLGKTEIEPGEFVVITAKNVDDPSAVTFASEPDIGFTPTFFADGDVVRALVPVSYDFTGNEVKFTCSYGEVSQDMTLDITPKTFRSVTLSISATIATQTRTATTMKAYDDAMAPVIAETSSTPLWEGTFIEGVDGVGKTAYLNCGFGIRRTISATGDVYRHEGVDYVLAAGSDVMAVNNGTVAYTGYLDYTGYTVVIDHGLGLKSYYYHMSATAVKVGDTVTKGDVIGYVGATGFAEQNKVHIGLAVYGVPVCPYDLWEEGIIMK